MPIQDEKDTKSLNPSDQDYQDKIDREFSGIADNYGAETSHPLGDKETLSGAEKSAESSTPASLEKNNATNPEKSFYNSANLDGISAKLSDNPFIKNKKLAGGILGVFLGSIAVIIIGLTSLGPLKFIHFSQMLQTFHFSDQETTTAKRLHNMFIYAAIAATGTGDLEKTRLGTIESIKAKKIDANLKKSGLVSDFVNGKFTGFKIDTSDMPADSELKKQLDAEKDPAKRDKIIAKNYQVDIANVSNGKIIADGTRNNRKLFSSVFKTSPDYNRITSSFAKRILIKRANLTYNPITRVKESGKQNVADKYKEWREERKARLSNNIDANVPKPGNVSTDDTGNANQGQVDQINNANQTAGDNLEEAKAGKITPGKLVAGGALALLSTMCTVRDISSEASEQQILGKIGPQMQVASEVTSVGSKIQDGGDVDIETAGQYNKSLDNPETGSSWSNASSIQYENGQNPSKTTFSDYPELIPNKEGAVTAVDDFFKSVDKYAGLGQSIDVVCGAFSFFDGISSAIIGSVPLLGTYINDLSAKGYSALIVVLAGETVDYTNPVYAGAVYGEAANVGARLMANESSASAGGRPLSTVEALRLKSETNAYIAATEDRNIAQKILDFNDPKNPLGKVASSLQQKDVIGSMKSLLNTDIFMPKLSAEGQAITDKEVYYGVPKFGFDPAKLDSELVENPYENAEWVAQNLTLDSQAVKDFEECTNVRVTSDWNFESLSYPEGILTNFADMPEKCKNDGDEALYRLRVLALDTITMKSYSCVTFDDSQACAEIYPENVSNSTTDPVSNQAPNKDGWVWPLAKNLKQGPCWNVLTSSGYHAGMDINTDDVSENNPAIAAHDGKVIATGSDGAAGNYITIKSTDGVYYSYQHLTGFKVRTGDNVTAGQPVGLVGKTGNVRASSAGHLHFVTSREDTLGSYSSSPQKNTFDPLSVLPTEAPNGYECIK